MSERRVAIIGGPCLALGGAFVLERYGETRCVP